MNLFLLIILPITIIIIIMILIAVFMVYIGVTLMYHDNIPGVILTIFIGIVLIFATIFGGASLVEYISTTRITLYESEYDLQQLYSDSINQGLNITVISNKTNIPEDYIEIVYEKVAGKSYMYYYKKEQEIDIGLYKKE